MKFSCEDDHIRHERTIIIIATDEELYEGRIRMPTSTRNLLDALDPTSMADQLYGLAEIARVLEGKSWSE